MKFFDALRLIFNPVRSINWTQYSFQQREQVELKPLYPDAAKAVARHSKALERKRAEWSKAVHAESQGRVVKMRRAK